MIKRQFNNLPVVNVGGRSRIVSAHWLLRRWLHQECNGYIVPTRITIRRRIDAHEPIYVGTYSCFFLQFSLDGRFDGFAAIHKSTGKSVLALEGGIFSSDEKQAALLVEEDGVNGQCG